MWQWLLSSVLGELPRHVAFLLEHACEWTGATTATPRKPPTWLWCFQWMNQHAESDILFSTGQYILVAFNTTSESRKTSTKNGRKKKIKLYGNCLNNLSTLWQWHHWRIATDSWCVKLCLQQMRFVGQGRPVPRLSQCTEMRSESVRGSGLWQPCVWGVVLQRSTRDPDWSTFDLSNS